MTTYDYIVVGAGAAGCVLTRRLIDLGRSVLLIESGPLRLHDSNVDAVGGFTNLWSSAVDWALQTTPQPGLAGRTITINQGRLVGGSSAINAMMYVRCNEADYKNLAKKGGPLWSLGRLKTALSKIENYLDGPSPDRYTSGLMSVRKCPDPRSYSRLFQAAASELGFEADDFDYNGPSQVNGAGPLQFNIGLNGKRHSAFNAYLEPVLHSHLLTLLTSHDVESLLFDSKNNVIGVNTVDAHGAINQFRCSSDVLLAAGALSSPQILLRSGVGDTSVLKQSGIPTVSELPAVGQNLMDHLQLPVIVKLKKPLPEPEILTGNVIFLNLNNNSPYGAPDLQLNFTPASPQPLQQFLPSFGGPVMIFLPILVQPRSVGSVSLSSDKKLLLDPQYLSDPADVAVFNHAIELIRQFTSTSAMKEFADQELAPGSVATEDYIRAGASTLWHPVGTCAIGQDSHDSVVDSHLRVHGLKGVRVCDASVTPYATSGNNHVPTMVIAEMAATLISEGH